jgi:hypothetical protein
VIPTPCGRQRRSRNVRLDLARRLFLDGAQFAGELTLGTDGMEFTLAPPDAGASP